MPLISPEYAFDRIVAPLSVAQFLSGHHEQKILISDRGTPEYFSDILTVETLDDFLSSSWPVHNQVFVVNALSEVAPEEYVLPDQRIDIVRLHQLFDEGATISFRQMQNRLPELAALCRAAEQIFDCPFQTNLYFTPAGGQGFQTHHDTHDVFVLQVYGSKLWRVYDPVIPLPLTGQNFAGNEDRLGPVTKEFTLNAGDLFYCPRGIPHDANATSEPSLHITLGALQRTWAEVMIEAMSELCLRDSDFRKALPQGYATGRADPAAMEETFRTLAERFSGSAQLAPAMEGLAEEFIASRRAMVPQQRCQIAGLDDLTLDKYVGARPGLIYRCSEADGRMVLHCHSSEISLPQNVSPAVVHALETPRFRARDLPGNLDDESKVVLLQRLIREGLVTTLD